MENNHPQKIRTRFAPSPTGELHMGNYRTALFSWLFAEAHKGDFIVRIEDTDRERSKKEYEETIFESLDWLELTFSTHFQQSENKERHKEQLQRLIDQDIAYISQEEGGQRKEVVRFRNPNKTVTFHDLVRGDITFDTSDLGDFVIAKSLDEPLFHLAVVVDDFDEGVTHIVRGEDHISNTPRHILLQDALGAPRPIYAHLPLVLNTSREKLSKRNGAQSLLHYKEAGFLPAAVINYMALLGWNPGTEQEIFSVPELVEVFDFARIHKGSAIFDETKLRWINKEHLKRRDMSENVSEIEARLKKTKYSDTIDQDVVDKLAPLFLERIETFGDVEELVGAGEIDFVFSAPSLMARDIVWSKLLSAETEMEAVEKTIQYLIFVKETLSDVPEEGFQKETLKEALWDYATRMGRGEVLWPLRFSLTGKKSSPDPFTVASIIGKTETLKRIDASLELLANHDV